MLGDEVDLSLVPPDPTEYLQQQAEGIQLERERERERERAIQTERNRD